MTEYFVEKFYDEYAIKQEDTIIAVIDSGINARKVCDLLNKQEDKLKIYKEDGIETIDELHRCRENSKKALKNLEIVFNVVDNKIKEFQNGEYGDLPCNTIYILLDLKEELSNEMSRK